MTESDSRRTSSGQRTLAAIVFTDAVDFSARVTETAFNEEYNLPAPRAPGNRRRF